jgi:hypothetical protein
VDEKSNPGDLSSLLGFLLLIDLDEPSGSHVCPMSKDTRIALSLLGELVASIHAAIDWKDAHQIP